MRTRSVSARHTRERNLRILRIPLLLAVKALDRAGFHLWNENRDMAAIQSGTLLVYRASGAPPFEGFSPQPLFQRFRFQIPGSSFTGGKLFAGSCHQRHLPRPRSHPFSVTMNCSERFCNLLGNPEPSPGSDSDYKDLISKYLESAAAPGFFSVSSRTIPPDAPRCKPGLGRLADTPILRTAAVSAEKLN